MSLNGSERNYKVPSVFFLQNSSERITKRWAFLSSAEWFGTKTRSSKCVSLPRNGSERNLELVLPRNGSDRNSVCSVFREKKIFLEKGNPSVIALVPKIPHTYIRQNSIFALQTAFAKLSLLHEQCYQQSWNLLLQSLSKYTQPDIWILIKTLCQKAVIFYSKLQRRVAVHNQTYYSVSFQF